MTTAAPPDLRRITEHDADFRRVKAATIRHLTHSLDELAHDLKHGVDVPTAQTAFVQRHTDIMRDAYLKAHGEGQHDYWQSVSNAQTPARRDMDMERIIDRMRRTLAFYLPSVAKMAQEAVAHWSAAKVITMDDVQLDQWMEDIAQRISLQADLTWSAFNDGYIDGANADAAKPFLNLYWELEPEARHCSQCPEYAAGSPYQAPGTGGNELDATPGDGHTQCGAACKCSLSYGPDVNTDVADWTGVLPPDTPLDQLWPELHGPIHIPFPDEATLTHAQKAALDRFRMAAITWHRWQGTARGLPDLPELFNPENLNISWHALTTDQQKILANVLDAIKDWIAATGGTGEVQ